MRIKTFRIGGIHPKACKLTDRSPVVTLPEPERVELLLSQGVGAPARPLVKKGDKVDRGQMVAEPGSFVSAALHSPIAGVVKGIEKVRGPQSYWTDAIIIESGETDVVRQDNDDIKPAENDPDASVIIDCVRRAGVVGMGGAGFPTVVKLMPPKESRPEVVIINGAECEPYLTCDDLLMQTRSEEIVDGTLLLMKAVGVDRGIIAIEENKPRAIEAIRKASSSRGIETVVLKKKYPQGGEKQLIAAVLGRRVPDGALPVSVGAIVDNVATAFAVHEAVRHGRPLTHRIVTVTGPDLKAPGNFLAPIGMPVSKLIEAAGGLPENTGKVIAGGPMMGRAVSNLDAPVTKTLSGVLVLPDKMSHRRPIGPCIRCGACIEACPMGLEPYLLMLQSRNSMTEALSASGVMSCIECGSCSYVCPSFRPLLDFIKLGKQAVRRLPKS